MLRSKGDQDFLTDLVFFIFEIFGFNFVTTQIDLFQITFQLNKVENSFDAILGKIIVVEIK